VPQSSDSRSPVEDSRLPTPDASIPVANAHADPAGDASNPAEAPHNRPIRPAERLAAAAEILACSGVPTQLVIAPFLVASGLAPAPTGAHTLSFVAPLLLLDTAMVAAMMVFFTRVRGESIRAVWLGSRPRIREALIGMATIPMVLISVVVLLNLLRLLAPGLRNVPVNPMEQMATQGLGDAVLFAFVAIVGGGVREELQRAFMLHRFERYLGGPMVGAIVLSIAFGLGHLPQGYDAGVITGALGAFWAVVYLRRRSVIVPMISHAGFNAIEVLSVALLKTP
jgi:membrane protease YdiL (CAAX protease family)